MHRALETLALLGVLAVSGAWAQDNRLTSATTTSGCSLSMEETFPMRKLSWSGECKNNLLEGHGVLSYESSQVQTKDDRRLEWKFKWVQSGLMREGKPEGMWIVADKTRKSLIFKRYRSGAIADSTYFDDVSSDSSRKNNYGNVKAWLDKWSKGNIAAPRFAYLLAGVDTYYENPQKFFSGDFRVPENTTASSSPAAVAPPQSSSSDDPTVFGRSARGS